MEYELAHPIPGDRHEQKDALDAACLALWGGKEWTKPRRGRKGVMPPSWKQGVVAGRMDKAGRLGEAA